MTTKSNTQSEYVKIFSIKKSSINSFGLHNIFVLSFNSFVGSQQFYIYAIDRPDANSPPPAHLDLPPKYEDVVKDPKFLRREVI